MAAVTSTQSKSEETYSHSRSTTTEMRAQQTTTTIHHTQGSYGIQMIHQGQTVRLQQSSQSDDVSSTVWINEITSKGYGEPVFIKTTTSDGKQHKSYKLDGQAFWERIHDLFNEQCKGAIHEILTTEVVKKTIKDATDKTFCEVLQKEIRENINVEQKLTTFRLVIDREIKSMIKDREADITTEINNRIIANLEKQITLLVKETVSHIIEERTDTIINSDVIIKEFYSMINQRLDYKFKMKIEQQIEQHINTVIANHVSVTIEKVVKDSLHIKAETLVENTLLIKVMEMVDIEVQKQVTKFFREKIYAKVDEAVWSQVSKMLITVVEEQLHIKVEQVVRQQVDERVVSVVNREVHEMVEKYVRQQIHDETTTIIMQVVSETVGRVVEQQVHIQVHMAIQDKAEDINQQIKKQIDAEVSRQVTGVVSQRSQQVYEETSQRVREEISVEMVDKVVRQEVNDKVHVAIHDRTEDINQQVRQRVDAEVSRQVTDVVSQRSQQIYEETSQRVREEISIVMVDKVVRQEVHDQVHVAIHDRAEDINQQVRQQVDAEVSRQVTDVVSQRSQQIFEEASAITSQMVSYKVEQEVTRQVHDKVNDEKIDDFVYQVVQRKVDTEVTQQQIAKEVSQQVTIQVNEVVRQQVSDKVGMFVTKEDVSRIVRWEVHEKIEQIFSGKFTSTKFDEMVKQLIRERINKMVSQQVQDLVDDVVRCEVFKKMMRWQLHFSDIKHELCRDFNARSSSVLITSLQAGWYNYLIKALPWSSLAMEEFKSRMKVNDFMLLDPLEDPRSSRLDAVFSLPQELWPVLPPGAMYCLEASNPQNTFKYYQHRDFPDIKVRVSTYFGKWCRHLVDYVVAWQPTPRAEAAWQLAEGKQPPLPWEPRQVVAHTTNGEYTSGNTRLRFYGPKSAKYGAEAVEYSDAHGIELPDTKAAHESAPRNSDKDRDAHLIDPPRPNTWGELARRPLISSLRTNGGGAYVRHVLYDHSGLRTNCGRRVPAGYYFTLAPSAATANKAPVSADDNNGGTSAAASTIVSEESSQFKAALTWPTLVELTSKQEWRTYDVPFNHPIHAIRAQDLSAEVAATKGCSSTRTFSDAAAVLQVAEQELRLPQPFLPGPVVVPTWDDIPRLYAEHMEAARALMPVTELDAYGSSKLHQLIYHLQCAATLEYDRLDAKLLLLPQMARLGNKSSEIDAWLQAIVQQAVFLYEELKIADCSIWCVAEPGRTQPKRVSVMFDKAATPVANPTAGSSRNFPDPLAGTSFTKYSTLKSTLQDPAPQPSVKIVSAHWILDEEWAAISKIMDTCRHAVLHEHWVRLRSMMTGGTQVAGGSNATFAAFGFACGGDAVSAADATVAGGEGGGRTRDDAAGEMYSYGALNRELLDYVPKDLEAMSAPHYVPPRPSTTLPQPRGYRGNGPLPPENVAQTPTLPKPVRCRGADDTPLPPEFVNMDLWNLRNKTVQAEMYKGRSSDTAGGYQASAEALSFDCRQQQAAAAATAAATQRLQASQSFTEARHQAGTWRSKHLQRAQTATALEDSTASWQDTGGPSAGQGDKGTATMGTGVAYQVKTDTRRSGVEVVHQHQQVQSKVTTIQRRQLQLASNEGKYREQVLETVKVSVRPQSAGTAPETYYRNINWSSAAAGVSNVTNPEPTASQRPEAAVVNRSRDGVIPAANTTGLLVGKVGSSSTLADYQTAMGRRQG